MKFLRAITFALVCIAFVKFTTSCAPRPTVVFTDGGQSYFRCIEEINTAIK